jgi:hypothetical protein
MLLSPGGKILNTVLYVMFMVCNGFLGFENRPYCIRVIQVTVARKAYCSLIERKFNWASVDTRCFHVREPPISKTFGSNRVLKKTFFMSWRVRVPRRVVGLPDRWRIEGRCDTVWIRRRVVASGACTIK